MRATNLSQMTPTNYRHILIRAGDKMLATADYYRRNAHGWRGKGEPEWDAKADVLDHCARDVQYAYERLVHVLPQADRDAITAMFLARPSSQLSESVPVMAGYDNNDWRPAQS